MTPYLLLFDMMWKFEVVLQDIEFPHVISGLASTCNYPKVGDLSRGWPECSLFNSYYTEVLVRALLLSLDCPTLPLTLTLECWVLSKAASSTIFWVFGMTWPGVEPWSPRPLANTLLIRPMKESLNRKCNNDNSQKLIARERSFIQITQITMTLSIYLSIYLSSACSHQSVFLSLFISITLLIGAYFKIWFYGEIQRQKCLNIFID